MVRITRPLLLRWTEEFLLVCAHAARLINNNGSKLKSITHLHAISSARVLNFGFCVC